MSILDTDIPTKQVRPYGTYLFSSNSYIGYTKYEFYKKMYIHFLSFDNFNHFSLSDFSKYGCGIRSGAEDIHAYSEGRRKSPSEYGCYHERIQ